MLVKSAKHLIFEVRFVMLFQTARDSAPEILGILDWFSIVFLQENHLFEVQNAKISRLRRAKISFLAIFFFYKIAACTRARKREQKN